jgi:hypothetical protein
VTLRSRRAARCIRYASLTANTNRLERFGSWAAHAVKITGPPGLRAHPLTAFRRDFPQAWHPMAPCGVRRMGSGSSLSPEST